MLRYAWSLIYQICWENANIIPFGLRFLVSMDSMSLLLFVIIIKQNSMIKY